MTRYRHTQIGWVMLGTLAVSAVSVAFVSGIEEGAWGRAILMLAWVIVTVGLLAFCSLTVTVDGSHLTVRFGLTPLRKRIRLAEIASFEAVRNPWYFGWGIQRYDPGWLINVSGFEAIEIIRTDGKELRIGTDDARGLTRALAAAVGERPHGSVEEPPDIAPTWR